MKVLQINNCHYIRGGADVVYFNTAKLLQKKGHEVCFFSMNHQNNISSHYSKYFIHHNDYRDLQLHGKVRAASSFVYNREVYKNIEFLINETKPDIAHIHLFMGGLTSSILRALNRHDIPIVYSVHDYRLLCPAYAFLDGSNAICEECKDKFYLRCMIKKCSEKNLWQSLMLSVDAYFRKYFIKPVDYIDRYIFVSKFIRQKHIDFNPDYRSKAALLYNVIPELDSIETSEEKGDYFLFYGRISREKGISTLIESAKIAGITLKVAGTGPLLNSYRGNINDKIQFLGFKEDKELWDLVRNASFIVVPSECYENNPLTVIEAYAHGKPVIGSRIGGIPEIVEDGQTGFLFDSGNIEQLSSTLIKADKLTNIEYEQMSKNARSFAEVQFHPDMHYNALMKIYENLIRDKSKIFTKEGAE